MSFASPSALAAEVHRAMTRASEAYNAGNPRAAEQGCRRALGLYPEFPPALHLLGLCLWRRGELALATEAMQRATGRAPTDARMQHDLGNLYFEQSEWEQAEQAYARAVELDPDRAESFLNLGVTRENLARYPQAERAYARAFELDPDMAAAASGLASLAESANRLDEAEQWVTRALALDPAEAVANLTRAQLDLRAGHVDAASERLEKLLQGALAPRNRSLALARLGTLYEQRADYARAFAAFSASKQVLNLPGMASAGAGIFTLATAERIARHADALIGNRAGVATSTGPVPMFLVGFPRSGTTLLDQILSSHPRVTTLEEKDNLQDLLRDFPGTETDLQRLSALDEAALGSYRTKYWARVADAFPDRDSSKLFIDKLPLNTFLMPVILRLFPQTRFIFALRDPRDVVLSCFMRAFGLNEAMKHFLTLEGTASYYAAVMQVGRKCLDRGGLPIHLLRYETLVEDTEGQARKLCDFLDLAWDPAMLKFQETARRRRINTPSYSQVVQPVYRSARARWQHYEKQLAPVLPVLQPFVNYFGYASATAALANDTAGAKSGL